MRLYRNGEPVELTDAFPAEFEGDRVYVRTPDGVFSGVAVTQGDDVLVSFRGQTFRFARSLKRQAADAGAGSGKLVAPMPGLIVEVMVSAGQSVPRGTKLLVLEAMKTQLPILMPFDGSITSVDVTAGQQVEQDALLIEAAPTEITG